jgi:hypothetical protein
MPDNTPNKIAQEHSEKERKKMNTRKWLTVSGIVALVMLALAVGLTQAQGPGPEEWARPQDQLDVAASLLSSVAIQGRLTDADGNPVADAWYQTTFRLYEQPSGGTPVCTDTHNIGVLDGLFSSYVDCGEVLHGQAIWMSVEVEGDGEMSQRQYFRPVPYALSLRPGALISDTRDELLVIDNTSTSSGDIDTLILRNNSGGGEALEIAAQNTGVASFATDGYGVYARSANNAGVYGQSNSPDGTGVYARGTDSGADLILGGNAATAVGDDGKILSDPAYPSSDIYLVSNDTIRIDLDNDGDGEDADFEVRDKDDVLLFNVDESGRTSVRGNLVIQRSSTGDTIIELGEGLDYAEGFDVSDEIGIAPGAVLVIDPDHPGQLTISRTPYDSRVAGIVAGARGLGSAVRLGAGQFDYDVALAGRVYCNVDATQMGVEPGDLLTTSAVPGYAMKVTDPAQAQGAILGKAMERLEQGERGQILVLVALQ